MANWRDTVNGQGLYLLARTVQSTARYQVNGRVHLYHALASGKPIILTAWHGMTMMLAGFLTRYLNPQRIVLLMPDDWRGQALQIFARQMGARPFPINLHGDATLGAARRLVDLVRLVKEGHHCYITPDGPDGPGYVIKPGVTYIAQKSGGLILPVGAYARHGYRLPRWDRYTVPYPFSRISIQIGVPLLVKRGEEVTAVSHTLTHALHQVTAQAAANYYERPI